MVKGDSVGDVMFYGRGAGSGPTGSAVVGDIMDVCRNLQFGSTGRIACTCFEHKAMQPIDEVVSKYYLRMTVEDKPKVLAAIANVLGDFEISIESVVQKATHDGQAEIVWVTHEAPGKNISGALERIGQLKVVTNIANWIRVED
jgi:homoserine dehydrogenase